MEIAGKSLTASIEMSPSRPRPKDQGTRWAFFLTVLLVLVAWIFGSLNSQRDLAPHVLELIPGASRIETRGSLFVGIAEDGQTAGYAALGQAPGYGGPIELLVGMNPQGEILAVQVVKQRETPGFFRLLENDGFLQQFLNKQYDRLFIPGQDLDAISGATLSVEGVAASARQAIRIMAREGLGKELPPEKRPLQVGIPELTLVGLYTAGYFGHRLRSPAWKRRIRWGTMLTGLVALGFIYTLPLTISQVISFLSGYWPDWRINLYWYLLVGGILFVTTLDAKNPYCAWFCPFGAFQECLGKISGARAYRPRRWGRYLTWMQRGLALGAILLGLLLRQPGAAGYEPFATLFDLRGTAVAWAFLISIVLASLVVYRPFCNLFCPIDPVVEFIAEGRRRLKVLWKKVRS